MNQPLAAIVTSGEAGLRWLRRDVPDLEEVAATIGHVVAQGRRAGEIVTRIRAFLKKQPAHQDMLQVDEIIEEATLLVARELVEGRHHPDRRNRAWPAAGPRRPDPASAGSGQSHGQCRPGHVGQHGPRIVMCAPAVPRAEPRRHGRGQRPGHPSRMTCRACLIRSSRPSAAAWAWDLRSVERRWKLTAANYRQ